MARATSRSSKGSTSETRRRASPPFRSLPPGIDCAGKAGARTSIAPLLFDRLLNVPDIGLPRAPRQLHHPGRARAHVLGGREVETGLGEHLPSELHVGAFHAH